MTEHAAAQVDHPARKLRHALLEDRAHGETGEVFVPAEAQGSQMRQPQVCADRDDYGQCPPFAGKTPVTSAIGSSSPTQHQTSPQACRPRARVGQEKCLGTAFARSRPSDENGCGEATAALRAPEPT